MPADSIPPSEGQLATDLPSTFVHITGHAESSTRARPCESRPAVWTGVDENRVAFSTLYTTSTFPVSMQDERDLVQHDQLLASGTLGLVHPGGTLCRMVDVSPGYLGTWHRTQTLDYGVVIEGCLELLLDSGEVKLMRRGDVSVQRGTMHAWRNPDDRKWARVLFMILQGEPLVVDGRVLDEDLGRGFEPGAQQ